MPDSDHAFSAIALLAARPQKNDFVPSLIVLGVVAAVAVLIYWLSRQAAAKRTEACRQIADGLGFEFLVESNPNFLAGLGDFNLFSQGYGKKLMNQLRGDAGDRHLSIFDYHYSTGGGKSRRSWAQTVICFQFAGHELPRFTLRPESVWHKIGALLGYKDINFEQRQKFSGHFLLRGENESAIRRIFTDHVLTFYEEHRGLSTECSGETLLVYDFGKLVPPEELRTFIEDGLKILSLLHPAE